MTTSSIYDARNNLSSLIRQAEGGEAVALTRHEKMVAVIVGYGTYEDAFAAPGGFFDRLADLKREYADVFADFGDDDFPRNTEKPDAEKAARLFEWLEGAE